MRLVPMLLLAFLTACPPPAKEETGTSCPQALAVELGGPATPGTPVEVWVEGAPEDATCAWTTDQGALADPGACATSWTPPSDAATYTAVQATLGVTLQVPGCDEIQLEQPVSVDWLPGQRVVILYNPSIEGSEDVARAYADFRAVPESHLCPWAYPDGSLMVGSDFDAFAAAVQTCIDTSGPQVHYLVPVWGVPYTVTDRIYDFGLYPDSKVAVSVDALLFMGGASSRRDEAIENPLYQYGDSMDADYDPYVPFGVLRQEVEDAMLGFPTWLVARMDGPTAEDALALVDRAREAQELADSGQLEGIVYVDGNRGDTPPATDDYGSYESGEWNMWGTRTLFEDAGLYEVVWDGNYEEFGTAPAPLTCPDTLYYAGWYQPYHYNDAFTFAPGAIGGHLDSFSAGSLRDTAWAAEALRRGITATMGAVNEPYVAGMPEYDQLFLYLLQGATYGEAAYESTTIALWMMTFVGDPLYRPYPVPANQPRPGG